MLHNYIGMVYTFVHVNVVITACGLMFAETPEL